MSSAAVRRAPALVTQFAVPTPPFGMVDRPRLTERLRAASTSPSRSSARPPAAARPRSSRPRPALPARAAWVTLEPTDDEPGPLLGRGADRARPRRRRPAGLGPRRARGARARVARHVHAAAGQRARRRCRSACVLVLDDVHVLRSRECLTQLSFLLLHAPDTLRLVLTARSDPRAAAARPARARPARRDPRRPTSRSPRTRARELLAAHGLDARATTSSRALHTRTEGWGAGPAAGRAEPAGPRGPGARSWPSSPATTASSATTCSPRCSIASRRSCARSCCARRSSTASAAASPTRSPATVTARTRSRRSSAPTGSSSASTAIASGSATTACSRSCCARAPSASWPTSCRSCTPAPRAGTPSAARGVDALEHAVQAARVGPRGRGRRRALVRPLRARRRRRGPRAAGQAPAGPRSSATRSWPRRSRAPRSTSATPTPPSCTSRTPSARRRLPEPRRRRYLETMALASLATARLEGDFDAALEAADALLAEAAAHAGGSTTARARRSCTRCSARRRCGRHRLDRAGRGAAHGRHARPRAPARLRRGVGAQLPRAARRDDRAARPTTRATAREAIELAARRGWSRIPQTACAHTALALAAFYDLRPGRGRRAPRAARAPPPRSCAGASWTSSIAHLDGAACGRDRRAARRPARARRVRGAAPPPRRRAAVRARRRWPRCAPGC